MYRKTIALTVAALLAFAPTSAAAAYDGVLQRDADALRALGITGVQVRSYVDGRRQEVTSGVGELATGRPVPANGRFRMGSTTKTFVATVVLQLVGEGRLSLDDKVDRWLPGVVSGNGNDGTRITVRQLLQHTAGIYDGDYPNISSAKDYYQHRFDKHTPEEIVRRAMAHPPVSGWSYANTGYVLLGMITGKVTGRPWHVEVDRRIVRPLHLRATAFPYDSPEIPGRHAHGYERFAAGEPFVDVTRVVDADASGGLLTTTADLETFVRALRGGKLLKPRLLAELDRAVPVDELTDWLWPGARYGLGVFTRPLPCGGRYWAPAGDQLGYKTRTAVTADGRRSVVVSMSAQLGDSLQTVKRIEDAVDTLVQHQLCS